MDLQIPIHQQYEDWYVLDEEFPWDVKKIREAVNKHLELKYSVPVFFCSTAQANRIVNELGGEEEEYLYVPAGIFQRELRLIFIFRFDDELELIESLFHEFRHVMQHDDPDFRQHFESDKKLPYKERITEMDAFEFANKKLKEFIKEEGI